MNQKSENLQIKQVISVPSSPIRVNHRKYKFKQNKSKDFIEIQKEERITKAYNKISDMDNKDQIINSLKLVVNVQERVELIDRILKRKQEIKSMKEKMTLYKLFPVFQILINKVRKKKEKEPFRKGERSLSYEQSHIEEKVKTLQAKFTTQFALSWLTDKRAKETIKYNNKQQELLSRVLDGSKETKFNYNSIKVSQQSKDLIENGRSSYKIKLTHRESLKQLLQNVQPKVNTGFVRKVNNEKMKQISLTEEVSNRNLKNNIFERRGSQNFNEMQTAND